MKKTLITALIVIIITLWAVIIRLAELLKTAVKEGEERGEIMGRLSERFGPSLPYPRDFTTL